MTGPETLEFIGNLDGLARLESLKSVLGDSGGAADYGCP